MIYLIIPGNYSVNPANHKMGKMKTFTLLFLSTSLLFFNSQAWPGDQDLFQKLYKDSDRLNESSRKSVLLKAIRESLPDSHTKEMFDNKLKAMQFSPFASYRALPSLFYQDLKVSIQSLPAQYLSTDLVCAVSGDLHVQNLGWISREGKPVFDLNDFDESVFAYASFDVIRFLVSIELFLEEKEIEFSLDSKDIKKAKVFFLKEYMALVHSGKLKEVPLKKKEFFSKWKKKIKKKKSEEALEEWTLKTRSGLQFNLENPELEMVSSSLKNQIKDSYQSKEYEVLDVASRLGAGLASLGSKRYYLLAANQKESLLLDIKDQSKASILANYPENEWIQDLNQGLSPAKLNVRMQTFSYSGPSPHYQVFELDGDEFLIKQRSAFKKSLKTKYLKSMDDFESYLKVSAYRIAYFHRNSLASCKNERNKFSKAWKLAIEASTIEGLLGFSSKVAEQTKSDWKLLSKIK